MKTLISILILLFTIQINDFSNELTNTYDTIVGKKSITNEMAGGAYRKRATGYFVINKNDTSDFLIIFYENKDDDKVGLSIKYDNIKRKGKLYDDRMEELIRVLSVAKYDYNIDSLTTVILGRLITTDNLAIDITNDFTNRYSNNYKITDYKPISDFLLDSKLAHDLNTIFKPYSKKIENIDIEKVFFTNKAEFMHMNSKVDSTKVPERILDCLTWIRLK
jgi:hypothetical protein